MATILSNYETTRRAGGTTNRNNITAGVRRSEIPVAITAAVAANDVIELCPVEPGLQFVPELSHVRLSNGNASLTVKVQHISAAGTTTDLTATRALTNAAVAFAPAAATKLPVLQDGRLVALVTAVTTAAAVEATFELQHRRQAGS